MVRQGRKPDKPHYRLMTLRDAEHELGLHQHYIYSGVELDLVHQIHLDGGKRTVYAEWELRQLRALITGAYSLVAA